MIIRRKVLDNLKTVWFQVIFISLLSFSLRFIYALIMFKKDIMNSFMDDKLYQIWAENILIQGFWLLDTEKLLYDFIAPGLPWIMALFWKIFGVNWLVLFVVNAIINSMTCLLIFCLSKQIFKNNAMALLTGFWSALYILYVYYVPRAGKEAWVIFLIVFIVYLLFKLKSWYSFKSLCLVVSIGVCLSLLIHIDERYISYIPLFFVPVVLFKTIPVFKKIQIIMILSFVVIVAMLPWTIRNYMVYRKIILLSTRTERYVDYILPFNDKIKVRDIIREHSKWYLNSDQIDSVVNGSKTDFTSYLSIDVSQIQAMRNGNLPREYSGLEKRWNALIDMFQPVQIVTRYTGDGYRFEKKWSLEHNLASGLTYGLLLPFSIIGFIFLYKADKRIFLFFILLLAWHAFLHVVVFAGARARYRLPVDFVIIITGTSGMFFITKYFLRKLKRQPVEKEKNSI